VASASTTQVLAASRRWLRPVIRILIRSGVTWREFAELSKTTFVEVASSEFGKRGRPTNVSRTSVLTGLARREVRRQREILAKTPQPSTGYVTKASLALSAWHLDPDFLDARGRPLPLVVSDDDADGKVPTFEMLVRRCGGSDVRPSTLVKELKRAQGIRQLSDGRIEPLQRSYIPHSIDEQLVRLWASALADLATTAGHNLICKEKTPTRFERSAVNDRVARTALPEFRRFLEREGQAFLERVDAWLTAHEVPDGARERRQTLRLGAGMYHLQD
jgi:uncharacterized protein DUF6502